MAPPENYPIMSATSRQSFRHLEHKNLSIISEDIDKNRWLQKKWGVGAGGGAGGAGNLINIEEDYKVPDLLKWIFTTTYTYPLLSSSILIRFPAPAPPPPPPTPAPHFFSQPPVSVCIFWNNGRILMFKVSKRPSRSGHCNPTGGQMPPAPSPKPSAGARRKGA